MEEEDNKELKEPNKYSWEALLDAADTLRERTERDEVFASTITMKGPHLQCNRNDCGSLTRTNTHSKKLDEENFDSSYKEQNKAADPLPPVPPFEFSIPKKKRGSSTRARQQEKALLNVSKFSGERMMMRITVNTSDDHQEEEDHKELREANKYSWEAMLDDVVDIMRDRAKREEFFASMNTMNGPHVQCDCNGCGVTRTSNSKKLVEEENFDSSCKKQNKADPRPPVPPFDFSIPQKKRGSSIRARQREKALHLKVSKIIGKRMMMRITFNTSYDHQEEEKVDVLKRKRPQEENKVKKAKRARNLSVRGNIDMPNPSPNLPDRFKRKIFEMGTYTDLQLVITKRLTATDCKKEEGRLSMPQAKTSDFLEEHEKVFLEGRNELHKKNDMPVVLIQPNLEKTVISLRQWDMNSKMYVLVKPWNDVVQKNRLQEGEEIQVWSFRVGEDELGFAIVRLPNDEEPEDIGQHPYGEEPTDVGQLQNIC